MNISFFQLPDSLVGNTSQAAAMGQNTIISNWILENPIPKIPSKNNTLNTEEIVLLKKTIDLHYANATKAAKYWQEGDSTIAQSAINDLVTDVLTGFEYFSQHFSIEYKKIIENAYNKNEKELKDHLNRLLGILQTLINKTNGTKTAIKNYEEMLANYQSDFNKDYENIISEIGTVSDVITSLKTQISCLQKDIKDNDSELLNTFIDTTEKELVQGACLFTSLASEDAGGIVSAGVQMGIADVKGIVKTIQLNKKTLGYIRNIRKLSLEVNEDEVILMVLVNVGTRLVSLGGTKDLKLDIIIDIINYWSDMSSGIINLLQNHPHDLCSQINTVNFSPTTEKFENPAYPPWNVIFPLEKAVKVFNNVLNMNYTVFENDTKFEALPSASMAKKMIKN